MNDFYLLSFEISTDTKSCMLGIKMARSKVLSPTDKDNIATDEISFSFAKDMTNTLLMDMADPGNVTHEMLSKLNEVKY